MRSGGKVRGVVPGSSQGKKQIVTRQISFWKLVFLFRKSDGVWLGIEKPFVNLLAPPFPIGVALAPKLFWRPLWCNHVREIIENENALLDFFWT